MATVDFYTLKDKNDALVLAPLNVLVLVAPYGTPLPDQLVDSSGAFNTLPQGWQSVGEIDKTAGVELAPDSKTEGIEGYGSPGTRRDFVTEETFTLDFTAQESRKVILDNFLDLDTFTNFSDGVGVRAKKRRNARVRELAVLLVAFDGDPDNEIFLWYHYPRVTVTARSKQSWSETGALTYGFTMSAKFDTQLQTLFEFGLAGKGFTRELAADMGLTDPIKSYGYNVSAATAGKYTITVNSVTTAELNHDAAAGTVKTALNNIGLQNIDVTGTKANGFTITGLNSRPTINASGLTGASTVVTTVNT